MNSGHDWTACSENEALLEDYASGQLNAGAAGRLMAHLDLCSGCREAFEEARLSAQLIRDNCAPQADPGAGFARRVMAAIREEAARRAQAGGFWHPLEVLAMRLAVTAALALAFLVGYGLRPTFPPSTAEVVLQPEVRELFPAPARAPASGDEVLMTIADRTNGK